MADEHPLIRGAFLFLHIVHKEWRETNMNSSFKKLAREEIRKLPLYVPGKPIDEVKREFGLTEIIKLASNENPWGPSPKAILAMHEAITDVQRYPDGSAYELKGALTKVFGLSRNEFLLGNGSEEIVQMIAKAFFRPNDEILMGHPSFPRYETVSRLMGAKPMEIPLENGYYPLSEILKKISSRTRAIFICNPNNPSGTVVQEAELRAFVDAVPREVILVFDEAYYEFTEDCLSGVSFLQEERPVIVLRTFSKAYGLAGIRLGYAIAHSELIDSLNRVREPFNANCVALAAALAALQDQEYLQGIIKKNREERERVTAGLKELGAEVYPSQTNFVMAFFGEKGINLGPKLLERGIIVRPGVAFGYPDALRISIGTSSENEKLLVALKEIVGWQKGERVI